MKTNYYLIVIGLVILLLGGGYYFYTKIIAGPVSIKELDEAHHSGDFEKSIRLGERAILETRDKSEEGHRRLVLATDYIRVQPRKGIDIFKSIASDASYGAVTRAFAVEYIADTYMNGSRVPKVALDMIFVGEPYGSYLEKDVKGNPNIPLAVRRLYEYSAQFYSMPMVEYRIGEWYAKTALVARINPNVKLDQPESEYVVNVKKYLKMGDSALTDFIASKEEDSQIGYAYWLKGMLLGNLAELTKDRTTYLSQAEDAFRRSLDLLRKPLSGSHEQAQSLWATFHYVSFLQRNYGSERASDIKTILTYLSDPRFDDFVFRRYLTRLAGSTEEFDIYDRENVLALAKFDSNFSALLKKLGWGL